MRWRELSGGLGDSGLLIPIAIALITLNGLSATAVFCGVGIAYVATALYFRVPVPVQPLKAFAAAAIALELDAATLAAGALLMSATMAGLALTGMASWLSARFPLVLVRGIQASVALLLAKAAIDLAERGNWAGLPAIEPAASTALALVACAFLLLAQRTVLPGALIVLAAGAAVGLAVGGVPSGLGLGPEPISLSIPEAGVFATALTTLVVAQIPLTFGNSVVATADAERSYFGEAAQRVTPTRLAGSIGLWNLGAGVTGGLPVCHGAGGVTAHYKLGARTAAATVTAGSLFIGAGLLFGDSLPALLMTLAPGALAGMLLFVAIQHAVLAGTLERTADRVLAAFVGVVTLASGNLAIGFGAGVAILAARRAWRWGSGLRIGLGGQRRVEV